MPSRERKEHMARAMLRDCCRRHGAARKALNHVERIPTGPARCADSGPRVRNAGQTVFISLGCALISRTRRRRSTAGRPVPPRGVERCSLTLHHARVSEGVTLGRAVGLRSLRSRAPDPIAFRPHPLPLPLSDMQLRSALPSPGWRVLRPITTCRPPCGTAHTANGPTWQTRVHPLPQPVLNFLLASNLYRHDLSTAPAIASARPQPACRRVRRAFGPPSLYYRAFNGRGACMRQFPHLFSRLFFPFCSKPSYKILIPSGAIASVQRTHVLPPSL
jgi:hypothetical protein